MGIIFNFDDVNKMQPDVKIIFANYFVWLDWEPTSIGTRASHAEEEEEEEPPSIYMFLVGLEDVMEVRALALAHHMPMRSSLCLAGCSSSRKSTSS